MPRLTADGTYPDKDEEVEEIIKIVSPYCVMPQGTYMGWPEKATFKSRLEWLRDNLGTQLLIFREIDFVAKTHSSVQNSCAKSSS